jgi:hypothetical protein
MFIFIYMLLLPEGQWEPSKMQCSCGNRGALHTKILSLFFVFKVWRIFYSMGANKILWRIIHTYTHARLEPRYKYLLVQDHSFCLQWDGRCPNPIADPSHGPPTVRSRSAHGEGNVLFRYLNASVHDRTVPWMSSLVWTPPYQTHWRIFDRLLAGTWLPQYSFRVNRKAFSLR